MSYEFMRYEYQEVSKKGKFSTKPNLHPSFSFYDPQEPHIKNSGKKPPLLKAR